jgi:hypothetical protein
MSVDCVRNVMAHAQKPDFVCRRNGRVHLNRRRRQFSRLLTAEVCASAVVMLDTPCTEVVWRVLATHSTRQFPLHFHSRVSYCAITFQLDSTNTSLKRQVLRAMASYISRISSSFLVALITAYWQALLFSSIGWKGQFIIYFTQHLSTATHFMEQSPSWEATRFTASQEISRILCNPKIHYRLHKSLPSHYRMSHWNQQHWCSTYLIVSHLFFCTSVDRRNNFHVSPNLFK